MINTGMNDTNDPNNPTEPNHITSFKHMKEVDDMFPPKKQPVKKLEEGFDVESIKHITTQVVQFLMTKAIHESQKQDKYNQTALGNVNFHIDYNDITKETKLVFDKHPKTWDVKQIIEDIRAMEGDMMMEKEARQDILDNPFTY